MTCCPSDVQRVVKEGGHCRGAYCDHLDGGVEAGNKAITCGNHQAAGGECLQSTFSTQYCGRGGALKGKVTREDHQKGCWESLRFLVVIWCDGQVADTGINNQLWEPYRGW